MARSIDRSFYKSKAWKDCRQAYIKKCGGLCERCLANGIYKAGYIVHHKIHLNEDNLGDPNISLSFDNLEYLCQDCHNSEHMSRHKRRYKIDDNGNILILNDK
jgi:5-methylcytosine-specific restriction endonuclease McrA